jgi:hypothetical protein
VWKLLPGMIGVMHWIGELDRIDILVVVTMLLRFLAAPQRGHRDQAFHIFTYLKRNNRSSMVFDDTEPVLTLQCCCVSLQHRKGDTLTRHSISYLLSEKV